MTAGDRPAALPRTMRAWAITGRPGGPGRLRLESRPVPSPGPGEVLVAVSACGVCRTDLHLADGDLPARVSGRVPGHEIVGRVVDRGDRTTRLSIGDRIGVAWLRHTCGSCRWCRNGQENLCRGSEYTGWDADGGFAEYAVADESFAYRLPGELPDILAAPLLCSGIVGYRALRRAALPPGGRLGIYGFGASAHLTAQLAVTAGAELHVRTRGSAAQRLALDLGATSVGDAYAEPPVPLDAAILFAPVGDLVPVALAALDQAGTLAIAGIHLTDVPTLDYQRHLFRERTVTSVTANTRADGEEFLRLARRVGVTPRVVSYGFEDVDRAVDDVAEGRIDGAGVVDVGASGGATEDTSPDDT